MRQRYRTVSIIDRILKAVADVVIIALAAAALLALCALIGPGAQAADLGFNLVTHHNRTETDGQRLRTLTPGIYYRADNGATAGLFRNSFGDPAAVLGFTPEVRLARRWSTAATVGAVIGYRHDAFIPAVVPSLRLDLARWGGVRLAYLARRPGDKHGVEAFTLSLEIRR